MFNVKNPGPHLDHMLKQTRAHHVRLSAMADQKANMLLTIASVVITLSVPQLMNPDLKWPSIVLIFFSLVTIVLSTYAVMPKTPILFNLPEKPDIHQPNFNLLFFGDFAKLSYDEYQSAMEEVLNDHSKAYELQIRELHTLGSYLGAKKYRFIKLAYISFILGVFASVIVMTITNLL